MESLYIICEFFNITPNDFFNDESKAPAPYFELMKKGKAMSDKKLQNLLAFIELMEE